MMRRLFPWPFRRQRRAPRPALIHVPQREQQNDFDAPLAVSEGIRFEWEEWRGHGSDGDPLAGRGYRILVGSQLVFWDESELRTLYEEADVLVLRGAGAKEHHFRALQSSAFDPGSAVVIKPEPTNPVNTRALAILSRDERELVGYVPNSDLDRTWKMIRRPEVFETRSLYEFRDESGARCALRVVIAPPALLAASGFSPPAS